VASVATGIAAIVTAATKLWQFELGQAELRQLEPALLLRVAGSAAVAAGIATAVGHCSRCTAGGVNRCVAGWGNWSTAGGICVLVVAAGSRSNAAWVNWCTAGWVNRCTAVGLNAAAATAIVGLEQAENSGLGTVGDRKHHQCSCESNSLHLKFS